MRIAGGVRTGRMRPTCSRRNWPSWLGCSPASAAPVVTPEGPGAASVPGGADGGSQSRLSAPGSPCTLPLKMNRPHVALTALALLSVAGCPKKEPEKRAPATTETARPTLRAVPPAPSQGAAAVTLDCAKLVPEDVRKKHGLTDGTAKPGSPAVAAGVSCDFMKEKRPVGYTVTCPRWDEATFRKTIENGRASAQKSKDFRDLTGVGRMAYIFAPGKSMVMSQVWDDDTMCYATISTPTVPMTEELTKGFVANMSPELMK